MKKVASRLIWLSLGVSLSTNPALADVGTWAQSAIAKVAQQRTTPRSAQLRGATGVVEMVVTVDARGMITDYRMVRSSGVPILDREADLILMRVGSFDAPPQRSPVRVTIPIRW
jgi:TonB family protein